MRKIDTATGKIIIEQIDIVDARHPHIGRILHLLIGSNEIIDYIDSLLVNDREMRAGFDKEVFCSLSLIKEIHIANL